MGLAHIPDLLVLGMVFLVGWGAHVVGSRTHIPRITLLLAVGVLAGPSFLDLVPVETVGYLNTVAHVALAMVGFLLGESFIGRDFQKEMRQVLYISLGASLVPAILVFVCTWLVSSDAALALLLGGVATATAPAAILDVVREIKARGPLTRMLTEVVAIDDAWGVILFSLMLVIAGEAAGDGWALTDLAHGLWEVGGAVLLGILVGIPMSWLIGRHKPGEPTLVEAMGFVFVCGGIAQYFEVSYLLACMTLGATVARRAKHVRRPFHEIAGASEPFLVIFFLLSGLSLEVGSLQALGTIGLVYIFARSVGKIAGAGVSARLVAAPPVIQKNLGICLLPQAGVAIGMALLASERLPGVGDVVLTLTVASTVIFELFGPVMARWRLVSAGEANND